jgi:N-acetylmuramoyl-L-alanine amidase
MIFAGNAGHMPGVDPGAHDPVQTGEGDYIDTKEAGWCREVMLSVCKKLADMGHQTHFIQDDDLGTVCDLANSAGADVFAALHLNAAGNTEAQGPETFYYYGSEAGRKLANCVQSRLVDKLGAGERDRGIKEAGFYVIKNTSMPGILVEAGFVTNVWEESQINQQYYKEAVRDAIIEGVLDYCGEGV